LLGNQNNAEFFLGVKDTVMPTPQAQKNDAARLANYSKASDYKIFAEEVWARVVSHLDVMMDDKASKERVDFHRGACKEALDLLRLSYQARAVLLADKEQSVTAGR
jgi:hypothetical protein